MPNLFSTLENVLSPEEAIRNRKKAINTIGRVIPFAGALDLTHLWDDYIRGVIGVFGAQFGIQIWQNRVEQFLADMAGETAETILEGMLTFMKVRILLDPFIINGGFRRNLYNFEGKYWFCSQEGGVDVLVKFANTNIDWEETSFPQQVNVTTIFKNGPALTNFLINYVVKNDRDILQGVTENEIRVHGNLNYLFKFLFMVNHLLLEATGQLPH